LKEAFVRAAGYVRRNWKPIASLALTAFVALNGAFDFVPHTTVDIILGACASIGIYLHHKGDPLPETKRRHS
jgi:hypothetical protein